MRGAYWDFCASRPSLSLPQLRGLFLEWVASVPHSPERARESVCVCGESERKREYNLIEGVFIKLMSVNLQF